MAYIVRYFLLTIYKPILFYGIKTTIYYGFGGPVLLFGYRSATVVIESPFRNGSSGY